MNASTRIFGGPNSGPFGGSYGGSGSFTLPSPSVEARNRYRTSERISAGPRGVVLPAFLPYFDSQFSETPELRKQYREYFAKNPIIQSAVLGTIFGVNSQDLVIHPNDKESKRDKAIAEFVHWNLTRRLAGGVEDLIWNMLIGALLDGVSVLEKVWRVEERGKYKGKWVLAAAKPKDVNNDLVIKLDEFRNVVSIMGLRYNAAEDYDPSDFLILTHNSLYANPTGMSGLRCVYQSAWMYDTVQKLRAHGLDRRSMPVLMGEYATASQKPALEAALAMARYSNWISVPLGVRLQALEIAGRSQDEFRNALQDLREDIVIGITGASMQMLTGGQDVERGDSEVHRDNANLRIRALGSLVKKVLNDHDSGLCREITELNYVDADAPYATLKTINTTALQQQLGIDNGLHALVDLSKDEIYERYGRRPPKDDEDRIPALGAPPVGDVLGGGDADFALPEGSQDLEQKSSDEQVGQDDQASQASPDQAGAVQGSDLRSTLGGAETLSEIQRAFYDGKLPREAAMANVRLLLGFTAQEAADLFPMAHPEMKPADAAQMKMSDAASDLRAAGVDPKLAKAIGKRLRKSA